MKRTKDDILRSCVDLDHGAESLSVVTSPFPGGMTEYVKKRVSKISVPAPENAYTRTVRLHERIHAQKQRAPKCQADCGIDGQAIQDVLVHTLDWPENLPTSAQRDALTTAFQDLRQARDNAARIILDDEAYNINLLTSLRAMAIVRTCHNNARVADCEKLFERACKTLDSFAGGPALRAAFDEIIEKAEESGRTFYNRRPKMRTRIINQAREMFRALLRGQEEEPSKTPGNKIGMEEGSCKGMRIVELPLSEETNPANAICTPARSGSRLRPARLASAIANGSMQGLFLRRKRLPGGSVLIDASGSMEADQHNLSELCRLCPGATVAYYSGSSDSGVLVVFAKDGKRYAGKKQLPHMMGGNAVDLPALEWLLKQDEPRYIVTDRGFCGGAPGESAAALVLLEMKERQGEVTCIESIPDATSLFAQQNKGE